LLLRLLHHVPSVLTLYRKALAECGARDGGDSGALLTEESNVSSRGKDAHESKKPHAPPCSKHACKRQEALER
jgi:hypothetical protein